MLRNRNWLIGVLCFLFATTAAAQLTGPAALPAGFGATVSIDQHQYVTDFMPPGVTPPSIKMTLVVFNRASTPVTFTFPTSQRFDFSIKDSSGVEVWRWSTGRGFQPVVGTITLPPGQSVTFPVTQHFVSRTGAPLPQGIYTLTGELTSRDGSTWLPRSMSGTVSFKHTHVF